VIPVKFSFDTSRVGRYFNYANNPLTIAGSVLTTLSGLLIAIFLLAQLWGGLDNPYIGLFAYVVLPLLFVIGLLQIPLGMWLRRRRLRRAGIGEEELTAYPTLDFNIPEIRRIAITVIALTAINVVLLGGASFFAVEEMETDWWTHPNHIGHDDFPGCWRCHDDELATADGADAIPMDCENCHVFLVQDSPDYPEFAFALEQ
jgi:hypothetical protein